MFLKEKSKTIQIKFGVPYFDLFDPRFSDFSVPVSVRGSVSLKIKNFKKFLKQQGYEEINEEDFKKKIQNAIIRYIKESIINIPIQYNLSVFQIERKLSEIAELASDNLSKRMKQDFRISCSQIDISTIELDKFSEGYKQLKSVTQDSTVATIHTELEAKLKQIREQQKTNIVQAPSTNLATKKFTSLLITGSIIGVIVLLGLLTFFFKS